MHRRPVSKRRGFSLPELLTIIVVGFLLTTAGEALVQPVMQGTGAEQARVDLVASIDTALYRIQRDVRQSDPNGIFICAGSDPSITCTPGSEVTKPTNVQYFVILTGRENGTGKMSWDSNGQPVWTGFNVYWLVPNDNGSNHLADAFAPANIQPGADPTILNADVINAVRLASAASDAEVIAGSVQTIQTMVDVAKDHVTIKISSQSTQGGATGTVSVQSDAYARN